MEMLGLQAGHGCALHAPRSQLLRNDFSIRPVPRVVLADVGSKRRSRFHARPPSSRKGVPASVSRTIEVRRSPSRGARATWPSVHQPVDDAGDVAVRDQQEARQVAHQHAVRLAVERRHHVEAGQGGVELGLQPLAQLPSITRARAAA
jgi:hypothetical protein